MQGKLLFLGTGASTGVPVIGCSCSVCCSMDPRNQRLRSSALISVNGKTILIDAGPDFRQQALRMGMTALDGVIITHTHFDHIAGLDDLRVFEQQMHQSRMPCLVSLETWMSLKVHFPYLLEIERPDSKIKGRFEFQVLDDDFGIANFMNLPWQYMTYIQNGMKVTGIRIGSLAYVLDIKEADATLVQALHGVDTLIISALRQTTSRSHFSIDEAIEFARSVKAKQTLLSHIAHEVDYEKMAQCLPKDVFLAYDGMEVDFYVDA